MDFQVDDARGPHGAPGPAIGLMSRVPTGSDREDSVPHQGRRQR